MDIYQALAHPARREILALLRQGPMSAGELSEHFDVSKPTLSGHFAVLREAGLVASEKKGPKVIYHVNLTVLEEALSALMNVMGIGRDNAAGAVDGESAEKATP